MIAQVFYENWVVLGVGLLGAVFLLAGVLVWWRRKKHDLLGAIDAVTVDRMRDVLVPDGMGGHIQVEYLLLTAHGLVVIDVKPYEGMVFASDRMDEWTVMGKEGRFAFPNPQRTLYDRVAAIRRLVRDVRVTGHVLFAAGADFSKGRPKDVLLPGELTEQYNKPERSDVDQLMEAFSPHWERVREAVAPVDTGTKRL